MAGEDKNGNARQTVFPGTVLGTEEYVSGKNSGIDGNGNLIASVVGTPELNARTRSMEVRKLGKNSVPFEAGDTVFGRVSLVKENSAVIELAQAECNGQEKKVLRGIAAIMIRMVDRGFVKSLSDKFRIGDIVKAKVVSVSSCGVDCSTADSGEFGVVKAFCTRCRQPLHLFGMQLKCLNCGSTETRKISSDYVLK